MRPSSAVRAVVGAACAVAVVCAQLVVPELATPVDVRLHHPWHQYGDPSAAYVLEMLEAAHAIWPRTFFQLLSNVWAPDGLAARVGTPLALATPERVYASMDALVREHGSPSGTAERMDEWQAHVAMHAYAALVEASYQQYNTSGVHAPDCPSYIAYGDTTYCDLAEARAAILQARAEPMQREETRPTDHVYAPMATAHELLPAAVLYADPYDELLGEKHAGLKQLAADPSVRIQYILRWRPSPPRDAATSSSYLSGYGAALHLKKVDYLVVDDRHVTAAARGPIDAVAEAGREAARKRYRALAKALYASSSPPATVQDAVTAQAALSDEQAAELGRAAAHVVLSSANPSETLTELVHNFPAHAVGVAKYATSLSPANRVYASIETLQREHIDGGTAFAWINGKPLALDHLTSLEMLEHVRAERALLASFRAPEVGLDAASARQVLTHPMIQTAFGGTQRQSPRYDTSDRIEQHAGVSVIQWCNDLEDGSRSHLPTDLLTLLQRRWPGQPLAVAHNLFHLLLLPDLEDRHALILLSHILAAEVGDYGFTLGFVPFLHGSAEAEARAELLWYAMAWLPPHLVPQFIAQCAEAPNLGELRAVLATALRDYPDAGQDAALQQYLLHGTRSEAVRTRLAQTYAYLRRLGIAKDEGSIAFLNGQAISFSDRTLQEAMAMQASDVRLASEDIVEGKVHEPAFYYYNLPGTRASRSVLLAELGTATPLDLVAILADVQQQYAGSQGVQALRDLVYHDERTPANVTVRIVGDLDSEHGRQAAFAALHAAERQSMRVGFVHVPGTSASAVARFLYTAQRHGGLSTLRPQTLADAWEQGTLPRLAQERGWAWPLQSETALFWHGVSTPFTRHGVQCRDGVAVLVNGLAFHDVATLESDDFVSIVQWEEQTHVAPLLETMEVDDDVRDLQSQAIEFVTATLGTAFYVRPEEDGPFARRSLLRAAAVDSLRGLEAGFTMGAENSSIQMTFVLDPVGDRAPSMVAAIELLAALDDVTVTVLLNPLHVQPTLPLQQFTQFTARRTPLFTDSGAERPSSVDFAVLPPQAVLTLQLLAPRGLVTMAEEALYDLDNIRLADVPSTGHGVQATYAVRSVLVEGHARTDSEEVPRSLELVLETHDKSAVLDTIVMANMGYFQFRAQPGAWRMFTRAGRSSEVYEMTSVGALGWASPPVAVTGSRITPMAMLGQTIYPMFSKRPGMEHADLVTGMDAPVAEWSLRSLVGRVQNALHTSHRGGHADINIFTLASGHLYERMTYIMILSVLRHTDSSVKFWFVENFLSPSFKAFIPHLASAYGFQYEMITYAWPTWLREQTEKQRVIWAYKILFLDVLFPLDLDRVIFVDADQIVRADLKELVDMDLHGGRCSH